MVESKEGTAGARLQIKSVANTIKIKEANGKDATFERNLLKSWSKYEGYESAKEVLKGLNHQTARHGTSKSSRVSAKKV